MNDSIDVLSGSGNDEQIDELTMSILEISENIIDNQPPTFIIDGIYGIFEELEVLLSCTLTCGEGSKEFLVCFFVFVFSLLFLNKTNG